MKFLHKLIFLLASAGFFYAPAHAQNAGTVTNHAFVLGKGPGTTGYTSLLCGSAQLAVGQSAADPICRTITGDVTINASGVTAIGANKVTNSQLATAADSTIKSNISGSTASPSDNTITAVLDKQFGTTQGSLVYRNATQWVALAPGTSGQVLTTGGASANPTWTTVSVSVATIAALKAFTAPTIALSVYVQGYSTLADGGEGWFTYSTSSTATDDAGTIIQPNSLPASGRWIRERIGDNGSVFNVRWFGVKGDGTTENMTNVNAARDAAIAAKGALYFPNGVGYLLPSALIIPDNTHGLRIFGDAKGTPVASFNSGSTIVTSAASAIDMTGIALGGTGSISDIIIENINLNSTGTSGKALKVWNVDNITVRNVTLDATQGNALDIAGTAHFTFIGVNFYSAGGSNFFASRSAVGTQNIGPGTVIGGQMSMTSGAFPLVNISGDPLGVSFVNTDFYWTGATNASAIELNSDGVGAGFQVGSLSFIGCHAESIYNTTNTGSFIRVGNSFKWGTLKIDGGNFWGNGNGTNYMRDFLQVVAATNVVVSGVTASKLGSANGFSRAMIRLESTFPISGDTYTFQNNSASNISGSIYSDANGRLGANSYSAIYPGVNQIGSQSNDSACTGCIGEYIVSDVPFGSATALTSGTQKTITSITLTPGDWDVSGMVGFVTNGTTNITRLIASVSLTTNALDTTNGRYSEIATPAQVPVAGFPSIAIKTQRFSVASNTNVFLVADGLFTVSTLTAFGNISARRVR